MKLKEKSIELLNRAVADELTAVHQYMYFHFHCDDMGYDTISSIFKRIAITEMMHVERLAERILFLKGEVEMKTSKGVQKITDVEKMLEKAAEMEMGSVNDLFETEMDNLEKFGDNYLALQSIERSKTAAAGAAKQE